MTRIIFIIVVFSSAALYSYPVPGQEDGMVIIASFATSVNGQAPGVKRNIQLAASKVDGTVVRSGSVFSFNAVAGEASAENGFVDGAVLYADTLRMEPGGGVCQVSSTLFNALINSGLSIVERHRHYQPVSYVPLGLDATILYGKKDLKIKNISDHDITIHMNLTGNTLTAMIVSPGPFKFTYRVETEEEHMQIPFGDDENIRNGITVLVFRNRYRGEKLIDRSLLYRDFYPPVRYQ